MDRTPTVRTTLDRAPTVRRRAVALVLATALATTGAVLASVETGASAAAPSLGDAAALSGRTVGFALSPDRLAEAEYAAVAEREFSLVVAENAMKWDATEPARNTFTWAGADRVAAFATAQDIDLYGHTLVWHSQLPGWVSSLSSADELRAATTRHITEVAGRYAGQVTAWDVVNEAFLDDGSRRPSVFQQTLGDGYVEEAFRAARAADPTADLCINDYSTDAINAKSTAIYELVKDFRARGVPIDCVGFQAHLVLGQVPSTLQANLQRFADLGVDVRITELDIRMTTPADPTRLAQQARDYRAVFAACQAVSRCTGVTLWGITDKYSWIPGVFAGQGAALVWDSAYVAKPAYAAIAEVLGAGPTAPPTTPPPGSSCAVRYAVAAWSTGLTAAVTVTNTGTTPLAGWSLAFDLPSGQVLTQGWSGRWTQTGAAVTVTNEPWNATLAPGASASLGFNASHTGGTSEPLAFTLGGTACTVA